MSDLNDIPITSIIDMSPDEAIEHLRQMRLARRTPIKPSPSVIKKREAKAKAEPKLSADQAADLLKLLEEGL